MKKITRRILSIALIAVLSMSLFPIASASITSPYGQVIEVLNGNLYIDNTIANPLNLTISYRQQTSPSSFITVRHTLTQLPEFSIQGTPRLGAMKNTNGLYSNVAFVRATGIRVVSNVHGTVDLHAPDGLWLFYDINGGSWVDVDDIGITWPGEPFFTEVRITPSSASVQRGATQQFSAQVFSIYGGLPSGVSWQLIGAASPGTTLSGSGLLTVALNESSTTLHVVAISTQAHLANPNYPNTLRIALVTISGTVPSVVSTQAELENAIAAAPANIPHTIQISNDIDIGDAIVIPSNRRITLVSTNTAEDPSNVRTLSQSNFGERHFVVFGRLTLNQNIRLVGGLSASPRYSAGDNINARRDSSPTLYGKNEINDVRTDSRSRNSSISRSVDAEQGYIGDELKDAWEEFSAAPFRSVTQSGGVAVGSGGILTMNSGSVIEDCLQYYGGGVQLLGSGSAESTRATFNLSGGTIQNNISVYGGAVDMDANSRMNMTSGVISGNQVYEDGGAIWIGTGPTANGQGFNMTGGSIIDNLALVDGGGIFTTDFASGYLNITTGSSTVFLGNYADGGAYWPPINPPPHISSATTSISIVDHVLNNWDIVYLGH